MTQVTLTVAANWFTGGRLGLRQEMLAARQRMTFDLTHNWLPGTLHRIVARKDRHGASTAVELTLREFGPYDYRTTEFKIDVGLEQVPTDPRESLGYLMEVQDELRELFGLFLLGVQERFGDIGLPVATFRVSCYQREAASGVYTINMESGCIRPHHTNGPSEACSVASGQPIGAA